MNNHGYTLWLDGGIALLMADTVSADQRQAVLDTLLYAQLLADKRSASRFGNYQSWYREYRMALSARGWIMTQIYHDTQSAGDCSVLVPAQPLQLWLATRQADADDNVARALHALGHDLVASKALRDFTLREDERGTYLTLEVGLVLPGPVVHLCSISAYTTVAADQAAFDKPLDGKSLLGDIRLKGLSATLDMELFTPHRTELRRLVERKQQERCYLVDLGALPQGVVHG
ncbi:hypothetical protein ACYU03_23135 [Pseudomonas sp. X10]